MKLRNIATLLFCFIAIFIISKPIYQNWNKFTEKYNPLLYEKKYNASQYMVPQSKNPISDEELLSHAGYKYIHGLNPILINSDHPPLGKYIIGLFTVLTGNNRTVSLFFAVLNILLLALIVFSLTKSPLFTSLGFFFLSLDPMLIDQVIHSPILDIIQVSFLLLYIFLFIRWNVNTKKWYYIFFMAIALGCLSSIKLYFPALIVVGVTCITLITLKKPLSLIGIYSAITLPIAFFTYAASYFKYFIEAKAFLPFFGVQKWIFLFWQNNSINQTNTFGNVIPFIIMNKWKVWWGTKTYLTYSGWTIVWPIFFILGLSCSFFFIVKYMKRSFHNDFTPNAGLFLSIWILVFSTYLCFIPISPRYLMMLYFPIYILVILVIYNQFYANNHGKTNN